VNEAAGARANAPSGAGLWLAGARPRTLGASVAPVIAGVAAAPSISWLRAAGALVVAVALQVGVNYANDYSDGVRGVDAQRVGPVRLTASGLASPAAVRRAALLSFLVAGLTGLALAIAVDLRLLAVGAAALLAAAAYSGGPKPYAGLGLGEVFVFVFFGPVATAGTAYVTWGAGGIGSLPSVVWWGGAAIGLLAVAILLANNIRDIPTDAAAGKRTLPVRLGDAEARALYRGVVVAALATVVVAVVLDDVPPLAMTALAAAPFAVPPLRAVGSARGPAMVPVLLGTAALNLAFGMFLAAGLTIHRVTS